MPPLEQVALIWLFSGDALKPYILTQEAKIGCLVVLSIEPSLGQAQRPRWEGPRNMGADQPSHHGDFI